MKRESFFWRRVTQTFVGLFFIGAAYFKLHDSFFGAADVPMKQVFDYWLAQGWPIWGYRQFMIWITPYADLLGASVIVLQGGAGLLLVYNRFVRLAGLLLFFVQLNIFLATYGHIGFNVFVGISLWIALFYIFQGTLRPGRSSALASPIGEGVWRAMTLAVILLSLLALKVRYDQGDPWLSTVSAQRTHFAENIMSVSPVLKYWVLTFFSTPLGTYAWAGVWWLHLALTLGLLSQHLRLICGASLVILWMARENIWTNTITSEGVLWTLFLLTFVSYEEERGRFKTPLIFLPTWSGVRKFLRFVVTG